MLDLILPALEGEKGGPEGQYWVRWQNWEIDKQEFFKSIVLILNYEVGKYPVDIEEKEKANALFGAETHWNISG